MDKEDEELEHSHEPEAIRLRLGEGPRQSVLRDVVFGAMDGTVTTFAVVAGASGAELSPGVVLVMGAANILADGFSMGVGNFLGARSQAQLFERVRRMEERHVRLAPEGEREEVRQIFAAKGFFGENLDRVVAVITSSQSRWVETMLREEHGFPAAPLSPLRSALATFFAFLGAGALPLFPFAWAYRLGEIAPPPFPQSVLLTTTVFFTIGAAKGVFVGQGWLRSGCESLGVGGAAAAIAYGVGVLLKGLVS